MKINAQAPYELQRILDLPHAEHHNHDRPFMQSQNKLRSQAKILVLATDLTLSWAPFSDAAEEAGTSHVTVVFISLLGDVEGRRIGRAVGKQP